MATSFEPIKFANLTEKTTAPSDADIIVIEDSTATKKAKWSNLISWIKSKLNIGSADISSIGDGTVTGAINTLNTNDIGNGICVLPYYLADTGDTITELTCAQYRVRLVQTRYGLLNMAARKNQQL